MNIVLINHYAGSLQHGMEYRPYYMAKAWQKAGHTVTIIAATFSHVRSKQPTAHQGHATFSEEMIDGIRYIWVKTPEYGGNGISRVKNIMTFLFHVYRMSKTWAKRFQADAVIASSTYPMDNLVAHRLAKMTQAKFIYEVHDLWPLSPVEIGGMSPKHPFIRLCQFSENYAYKHCDATVSMLPKVHEHMQSHGLDLQKLHIIPNGIVEEDWLPSQLEPLANGELKNFLDICQKQGKTIVGYAGSHGTPNAMEVLLDAAKKLPENIAVVLVGSGLEKQNLINKQQQEDIHNVSFFDPIPKKQIPALLNYFDIAYIGWQHVPIYRFGISPNKLMDYMMAGKAIVHSVEAGNDPVTEQQCGMTVPPLDSDAVANAIMALQAMDKDQLKIMGDNGKRHVKNAHTYTILAQQFLKAIES